MRLRTLIAGVIAGLYLASPAAASVSIKDDPGGVIADFLDRYTRLRVSGEHVVVSGYCHSACTLITGIIPRSRVCVKPGAVFGFHSASRADTGAYSPESTRLMWSMYPADVRARLQRKGWAGDRAHPDILTIQGRHIYRLCGKARG